MQIFLNSILFILLFTAPNTSLADSNTLHGFIAVGPGIGPEFEGSKDYELLPLVVGRVQLREFFFEIQGPRGRANLLPRNFFSSSKSLAVLAGPTLGYRNERSDLENDRIDKLRDVDAAVEVGGFIGIQATSVFRKRDFVLGRIEVVQDMADAHDGLLVTLRGSYSTQFARRWRLRLGADATYANDNYFDTYFSVDADNAARSGLATFEAEEGFKDMGLDLSLTYALGGRWSLITRARYVRLLSDAADSPIVDDEGSVNQPFVGIAISYRF
jgi:MipA family protein